MYNYKIKTSFVSPEMAKVRANLTGFNMMINHFFIRRKMDIIIFWYTGKEIKSIPIKLIYCKYAVREGGLWALYNTSFQSVFLFRWLNNFGDFFSFFACAVGISGLKTCKG